MSPSTDPTRDWIRILRDAKPHRTLLPEVGSGVCRGGPVPARRRVQSSVFLLALGAGGCVEHDDPAADPAVRDSAGVRIVEYTDTPVSSRGLAISPAPLYRHGAGDGDYPFFLPRSGVLLSDGSAVIADAGSNEVVLLGPRGSFRDVLATGGPGPAELGDVRRVLALGRNTILVDDPGRGRLLLLEDGSVARAVDLREHGGRLGIEGVDSVGRVLASSAYPRAGVNTPWRPGYMTRLDLETAAVDTIASYDWIPPGGPSADRSNPFKPAGHVTVASAVFVHGRSDRPELLWRRADGTVSQIVRWRPERTWPTDEFRERFEAYVRAEVLRIHADLEPSRIEEALRLNLDRYEYEPNDALPLYRELFGDREGRVWIGEYSVDPRHSPSYTVFSGDGEALGVIEVPDRSVLLDVAAGRVLAVLSDATDVETVVVYDLLDDGGGD